MATAWTVGGRGIIMNAGAVVVCDECPCEMEPEPTPIPTIEGCPGCEEMPQFWLLSISGITNSAFCADCDGANGTWRLEYVEFIEGVGCIWEYHIPTVMCGGVTWRLIANGTSLELDDDASLGVKWRLEDYECMEANVLDFVPITSHPFCETWPATVTITPTT